MPRLVLLPLIVCLAACQPDLPPDIRGRLYFASGSYVGEFDIVQGTSTAVGNRGAVTIRDVTAFTEGRLLLAETATVEGRDVPRISWIDLESGRAETLYSGVAAHYLPAAAALFWDDGTTLHVSGRRGEVRFAADIISHGLNQLSVITAAGDMAVLFEAGTPEARAIFSYNVASGTLLARDALSSACSLAGAVWITDRDLLACRSREHADGAQGYVLADLDGNVRGRLALPAGKEFLALAYAEDEHALFLAEPWRTLAGTERFAVWWYDFGTGQSHRIVRNQYLGTSAVFTRR